MDDFVERWMKWQAYERQARLRRLETEFWFVLGAVSLGALVFVGAIVYDLYSVAGAN